MRSAAFAIALLLSLVDSRAVGTPATSNAETRVSVFPMGEPSARAELTAALRSGGMLVLDAGMIDASARGAGYDGTLNMSLADARRLALVTGATVLVFGTVSVGERESDNGSIAFESFAGLFVVDGPSGRLLRYVGDRRRGATRVEALDGLYAALRAEVGGWASLAREAEQRRVAGTDGPVWDPDVVDVLGTAEGDPSLIPPRFFKKPSPKYTDDADRVHAVVTVDLVVQFNADGSYGPIEVVRWAGFGLDESAIDAVRACRFWPARRDGKPVTARALLRYNFRFRDR